MASVFPLLEFAKGVAGEKGEVILCVPPGAEVHTWQPRASDIRNLASTDLFIYTGSNMEPWLQDILRSIPDPKFRILEASQGLDLLTHPDSKTADPHIWLDFSSDLIIVDRIEKILSEIDPENSSLFRENANKLKQKLQDADLKFRTGLGNCSRRIFIIAGHAAFGYLARNYNLEQIALYGLSPDSEPSPKRFIKVVEIAKKHHIKVIYYEPALGPKLANTIAREVGAKTLVLSAAHNLTKKQMLSGVTFFDIMEENLKNLRNGLSCD